MLDDDARLMLAFRDGDRRAFEALFARYTPRVLTFLTRLVRDRARAEELTQDVFVRIYNAADRYEPKARFSTWILDRPNLVNELARAHRRYRARRPLRLGSADPAPAPMKVEAEQCASARRALASCRMQRGAARAASRAGREIAGARLSVSSVKSLIHRGRGAARGARRGGRETPAPNARLVAYLDEELGGQRRSRTHLAGCEACRARLRPNAGCRARSRAAPSTTALRGALLGVRRPGSATRPRVS
jgi:RNA polymerase sigma factor (sigma-70 family)